MLSGKCIQLLTLHAVHDTCDIVETTEKNPGIGICTVSSACNWYFERI